MKLAKRINALILALTLAFGMTITASAAVGTGNAAGVASTGIKGKITIDNAVIGENYKIYKVLELESYNREGKVGTDEHAPYSYKPASEWESWLKGDVADDYVAVDKNNYVTWVKDADIDEFAKKALAEAKSTGISPTDSKTADGTTVEFSELSIGYYLVDTSLGSLCSLDTTDQNVVIKEKNTAPTIDKQVQEDSDLIWKDVAGESVDTTIAEGKANTAQIGDVVNYQTIIKAYKGAENYVLHDKMSLGLTLNPDSITVGVQIIDATTGQSVITPLTVTRDYTVVTSDLCQDCDFHIVFTQDYLDTITEETQLVVTYSAILNENAAVYSTGATAEANTNDAKLVYGDSRETAWDQTITYTYKFNLNKVAVDKEASEAAGTTVYKSLTGAEFELYDAATEGNKINIVLDNNGTTENITDDYYRIATTEEAAATGFVSAKIVAGNVVIAGLDLDTEYWLEETKAPLGYNVVKERIRVCIRTSDKAFETENADGQTKTKEGEITPAGTITVINKAGIKLPSAGGVGTTVFYVASGIFLIGAAALYVLRRRMDTDNKE